MTDLRLIDDLTPYANNSRTHPADQVGRIAASIDEFGMAGSIVIRDGTVAKGHGTLLAIRELLKTGKSVYPAPGRKADPAPEPYPTGMVPVIDASGWSLAQFRAFVIADNKTADGAGWDWDILASEMESIMCDMDATVTGFDEEAIDRLINDAEEAITAAQVQKAEAATDHQPTDESDFAREMADKSAAGQFPIVPRYAEKHQAFIIVCDNAIDEAWLRNRLKLNQQQQSYKSTKFGVSNVLTVAQFREAIQ